jgi:hypothetical protein
LGLVGPPEWPYAQVKDWILLALDIPHVDVRVYAVFRSLATRWRKDRRPSKDHIRYLVPGVNGKPMRKTALNDALARLAKRGLVTIDGGNANVRRVRNASGRFETVEELLWRVNELPIEGEDYAGPRSVFDALDTYPGPGWTDEQRVTLRHAEPADDRDRKSGDDESWTDQGKHDVSAGQTSGGRDRKSGGRDRKSGGRDRKSGGESSVTSGNTGHQTGVPDGGSNSFPPTPPNRGGQPLAARAEEGRKDDESESNPEPSPLAQQAQRLAAELPGPMTLAQRQHLATALTPRLAAGWTVDQLDRELTTDIETANSRFAVYQHRLTKALPDTPPPATRRRPASPSRVAMPPKCPDCDQYRRIELPPLPGTSGTARLVQCPACHPEQVRYAQDGSAALDHDVAGNAPSVATGAPMGAGA